MELQYDRTLIDSTTKYYTHTAYFTQLPSAPLSVNRHKPIPVFLQKLNMQLQKHFSDEKLNVHQLTRLVGMSRSDLHRKLVRTVGMSASEYVRRFRLNKAAKLLSNHPDWCIYQVALETGFNSQSYFSRRFKEVFGLCPNKWRSANENLEHTCEQMEHM